MTEPTAVRVGTQIIQICEHRRRHCHAQEAAQNGSERVKRI